MKGLLLSLLISCVIFCDTTAQNSVTSTDGYVTITEVPEQGVLLKGQWKFHDGDDSLWASVAYDDAAWKKDSTHLRGSQFSGIGWFRMHLRFDSSLTETPLAVVLEQTGASEVYINGKLMCDLGLVSKNGKEEERYNPQGQPIPFNFKPGQDLLIAVRYSNHNWIRSYDDNGNKLPGFHVLLVNSGIFSYAIIEQTALVSIVSGFLFGFFIALGLAHLFIYFFYRNYRGNIYYFIFLALLSHYILFVYFTTSVHNMQMMDYYFIVTKTLFPFFFISMMALVYSFYKEKFPRFIKAMAVVALINGLFLLLNIPGAALLLFFVSVVCTIETLRSVIVAVIRKQKGSRFLAAGVLVFGLFILLVAVVSAATGGFFIHDSGMAGFILLMLCLLCVMSIPLSMSVYLAWNFALTSKDLGLKLREVEDLSAKTLEQEKEKQKILETQKEMLETQVHERTAEINQQKHIIEEKNKDITDSINYAKRIQDAFLPAKELKYRLFPDAFVLFQPRDIVSGDFYWFSEKNGTKLIAAVDCTGHGVPGAFMSMIGNAYLNEVVNEKGITEPGSILNELRARVIQSLRQTGSEGQSKDGMDIALLSFGAGDSSVRFSGANNPLWKCSMENGQWELTEFGANKRPIGYYLGQNLPFESHEVPLKKGDTLYIFTDGFADQFGGPKGKKLKYKQMKELLLSIQDKPMQEQETILSQTFNAWKGPLEQVDDVLVIGVRI